MFFLNVLNLIPSSLQQEIVNALVDFVSRQAEKLLGDQVAEKLKKLRADAAFVQAFQAGLQRAADRFVREYEGEDEDLVAAIAADESFFQNEEVQQALLTVIKKPGVYLEGERETVSRSFETVLPGRKNRERVDRAVTVFLRCLAEEVWNLPELRGVYALQFQRTTAEAARQQVALQKAQLEATVGLSADLRQALLQLTEAVARKLLPAPPPIYHNLPNSDYGAFIGREEELAQVHRILRPYPHSQHALVTVDGIGGIGKSALALEAAHHYLRNYHSLPAGERFEAIIWTSAKASVLTANGIAPRQQIARTLEDIYTTVAVALEREDITRAPSEEQGELVTRALTRQRTLLVVDNLETVDDERVNAFLRELPAPTKAIVTTRHRIGVAYPLRLTGMPRQDGLALIAHECAKKGVTLTGAEAERLYERTGGVPLAIVWCVAQMGYGYEAEAVLHRLGQPEGDIARFCFERAVEHIRGAEAHELLMALCLFAADASREALGYVADLPDLDRDDGLAALERLSLLNRQSGRFSLLPLTRSYVAHELAQRPEFEQSAFERLLAYYTRLVTPPPEARVGVPYWDGVANYARADGLEPEWGNLAQVIRRALDQQRYAEALDLFLPIVHFLAGWGLWDERMQLGREMCQAAHELGDPAEVWLWIDAIGWILLQRHQFLECLQALKTGRLLAHQFNFPEAAMLADIFEGRLYRAEGDTALAIRKVESVLQQLDLQAALECGAPLLRIVVRRVAFAAASLSHLTGDLIRAKEFYEHALALTLSVGANPSIDLSNLAHVSLLLQDTASAEKFLVQALATGAGLKDRAWINYELAGVAEQKGELREARRLCELALEQFTQLGIQSGVQHCQQLLGRLQERN